MISWWDKMRERDDVCVMDCGRPDWTDESSVVATLSLCNYRRGVDRFERRNRLVIKD